MNHRKRDLLIAILAAFLIITSLIGKSTITGRQVLDTGCCVKTDGCVSSTAADCAGAGDFYSGVSCEDTSLLDFCQPGCCFCINSAAQEIVRAEYVDDKVLCNDGFDCQPIGNKRPEDFTHFS